MTIFSNHFWLENTVTERIVFFQLWQEKTCKFLIKLTSLWQAWSFRVLRIWSDKVLLVIAGWWWQFPSSKWFELTIFFIKMIWDEIWSVTLTSIYCQYDWIFPVILMDKSCHWTHSFFSCMTSKNLLSWQVCDDPGFSV